MGEKITAPHIVKMKRRGEKITCLTAYDYSFARILDEAGVEMLLVGDSLGCVVQGNHNTLAVTMDEMIYPNRTSVQEQSGIAKHSEKPSAFPNVTAQDWHLYTAS